MNQFLSLAIQVLQEEIARKCQPVVAFWSMVKRPTVIILVGVATVLYVPATFTITGIVFVATTQVVGLCGFFIAYVTFMTSLYFGIPSFVHYADKLVKLVSR